jgi:hypothetical protein
MTLGSASRAACCRKLCARTSRPNEDKPPVKASLSPWAARRCFRTSTRGASDALPPTAQRVKPVAAVPLWDSVSNVMSRRIGEDASNQPSGRATPATGDTTAGATGAAADPDPAAAAAAPRPKLAGELGRADSDEATTLPLRRSHGSPLAATARSLLLPREEKTDVVGPAPRLPLMLPRRGGRRGLAVTSGSDTDDPASRGAEGRRAAGGVGTALSPREISSTTGCCAVTGRNLGVCIRVSSGDEGRDGG